MNITNVSIGMVHSTLVVDTWHIYFSYKFVVLVHLLYCCRILILGTFYSYYMFHVGRLSLDGGNLSRQNLISAGTPYRDSPPTVTVSSQQTAVPSKFSHWYSLLYA